MASELVKSGEQVLWYGDVFTADREVNAMLILIEEEMKLIDRWLLEPVTE